MSFGRAVTSRLRGILPPLVFAALTGYFIWHSVHGDLGLLAREQRLADVEEARRILARAEAERDWLERRVAGLRGGELDRDQLEERARTLLNMVGPDELVVPYPPDRHLR